jgi:hypothetical protein
VKRPSAYACSIPALRQRPKTKATSRIGQASRAKRQAPFHSVHDAAASTNEVLVLPVRAPGALFHNRWDRSYAVVLRSTSEPTDEHTIEQLGSRGGARHGRARRMDDMSVYVARPKPSRQTEFVATCPQGDQNAWYGMASLDRFFAPAVLQLQEGLFIQLEVFSANGVRHPERCQHRLRSPRCDIGALNRFVSASMVATVNARSQLQHLRRRPIASSVEKWRR